MSPRISGVSASGGSCSTGESMIYLMRSIDTPALLISAIMRPSMRIGHMSIELYEMKATYSPACIRPRIQNTAPKTTTSRICTPESTSALLQ